MFQIVTKLITPRALFSPILLPQNQIRIGSDEPFQICGHSKLYKTSNGRDLGFGPTGNSPVRPADLENPIPQNKTCEVDRMTRCRDMAIRNLPKCEVGRSSVVGPQYKLFSCRPTSLRYTLGTQRARSNNTIAFVVLALFIDQFIYDINQTSFCIAYRRRQALYKANN